MTTTSLQQIQALLAEQPKATPTVSAKDDTATQESIRYLSSDEALQSIAACPYWPKWDSPWWHMSALFEMGLADRIPKGTAQRMLSEVKSTHLPYFFREEAPPDKTARQDAPCPCSFGNIYQILNATGLSVDDELPWARAWFLKYQMPDGGFNCDVDAHRADPNASSLVGTISPLEAILTISDKLTAEEERFLDRGAACLIARELRLGSSSQHNAEERLDESDWLKPCFPRLYFYDVLRGLSFILRWAELRKKPLPASAIVEVVASLCDKFDDGQVRVERHSFEGVGSRIQAATGEWIRSESASHFPLLVQVSEIGQVSPYLTTQWNDAKERIGVLIREGLIA